MSSTVITYTVTHFQSPFSLTSVLVNIYIRISMPLVAAMHADL